MGERVQQFAGKMMQKGTEHDSSVESGILMQYSI